MFLLCTVIVISDLPVNQMSACSSSHTESQCSGHATTISNRLFCQWLGSVDGSSACVWTAPTLSYRFTAFAIAVALVLLRALRSFGEMVLLISGAASVNSFNWKPVSNIHLRSWKIMDAVPLAPIPTADIFSNELEPAQAEPEVDREQLFDRFAGRFRQYVDTLREKGMKKELKVLTRRWQSSNPKLFQYIMDTATNPSEKSPYLSGPYSAVDANYSTTIESVSAELARVQQRAHNLAATILKQSNSNYEEFSANLLFLFMNEHLGAESCVAKVFRSIIAKMYFMQESKFLFDSNIKFVALLAAVVLYECGICVFSESVLNSQTQQNQTIFVFLVIILLMLDFFVVEVVEFSYSRIFVPFCLSGFIGSLSKDLSRCVERARQSQIPSSASGKVPSEGWSTIKEFSDAEKSIEPFYLQQYQYCSSIIAGKNPHAVVSQVILALKTPFPTTVGTLNWPSSSLKYGPDFSLGCRKEGGLNLRKLDSWILSFLTVVSMMPFGVQEMLLSLTLACLGLCVALLGEELGSNRAGGVIAALVVILAFFVIVIGAVHAAAFLPSNSTKRIAPSAPNKSQERILEEDIELDFDLADMGDPAVAVGAEGRVGGDEVENAEEHKRATDSADELRSRHSSIHSLSSSSSGLTDCKTEDSLENYISAPVYIDFNDFEFDSPLDGIGSSFASEGSRGSASFTSFTSLADYDFQYITNTKQSLQDTLQTKEDRRKPTRMMKK